MKLHRVTVKNFRLLEDTELILDPEPTLIVGRNNSGKTSFSEVVRRFTSEKVAAFGIQDFSTGCYDQFCEALDAKSGGADDEQIRSMLPYVELRLFFSYGANESDLSQLSEFIVDLNMDCNEALVVLRYELGSGLIERFFEEAPSSNWTNKTRATFFREIGERLPKLYKLTAWAEDPNDSTNKRHTTQAAVRALICTHFINAQRGLDDITTKESDVLAKILEALFNTASSADEGSNEKQVAKELDKAVQGIQEQIDAEFTDLLTSLLPTLEDFGYPGLGGSKITTETALDVQRLLTNHTKVRYLSHNGISLPETYNGLGMRNLIFILFQILSFYRSFRASPHAPGITLIFIEEPEAHLHPQMQEVFIRQIKRIVEKLNGERSDGDVWSVQFVVSTHSSHIANEAGFSSIRYFLPKPKDPDGLNWRTDVKDLREGLGGTPEDELKFLHQYLTLTRCDLFFADKAILIEGTSERLLLPAMIQKLDNSDPSSRLLSQYITVLEVGGAYAHIFIGLLDFLELDSLIITDLDPITENGGTKCIVQKSTSTSNSCIKNWFDEKDCSPLQLVKLQEDQLVRGRIRITFQRPEGDDNACGRTLEDAFMLANPEKFEITGDTAEAREENARTKAEKEKKSAFALRYAIHDTDWSTPKYIHDGLLWLGTSPVSTPGMSASVKISASHDSEPESEA